MVTGYFLADTITFGSNMVFTAGSYDMFIVKYDASGNVLWARGEGDTNDDRGESVAADDFGNVFIGGVFRSDTITIGSTTLTWAGGAYSDIFLVKYDDAGNVIWVEGAGGDYLDEPDCVTTDALGNIYMSGIVYSTYIVFGTDTLYNIGSNAYGQLFFVKYDASGNVLWSDGGGAGNTNDWGASIVANPSGNITVTGLFGNTITFGSTTLTGGGIFVVQYDNAGNVLWAINVGNGVGNSITADNNGNMFVAGYHWGPSITFGSTTLTNVGAYDMFVAKLIDSVSVTINTPDDTESPVSVYPNPFSTSAVITFSNEASELYVADIYDVTGKIVRTLSTTNSHLMFHRQQLASGLYFLQLKTTDAVIATGKILIE